MSKEFLKSIDNLIKNEKQANKYKKIKMNTELMNKRNRWYTKTFVLFELLKSMKDREVVFMHYKDNWKCIRGLRITSIDYLKDCFNTFRFLDKNYNIYVSVAKYRNIPNFTHNLSERSKFTSQWFLNDAKKEIFEYDVLLDFDSGNSRTYFNMSKDTKKTLEVLNFHHVCYRVYPSGNNFQIIIDSSTLPDCNIDNVKRFTKNFKKIYNLKTLDLKGIGNYEKIRKCEYSLVNDRVILPINRFEKFNYIDVDSNRVLTKLLIKNRGFQKINNFGISINKSNFNKMLQQSLINWRGIKNDKTNKVIPK